MAKLKMKVPHNKDWRPVWQRSTSNGIDMDDVSQTTDRLDIARLVLQKLQPAFLDTYGRSCALHPSANDDKLHSCRSTIWNQMRTLESGLDAAEKVLVRPHACHEREAVKARVAEIRKQIQGQADHVADFAELVDCLFKQQSLKREQKLKEAELRDMRLRQMRTVEE